MKIPLSKLKLILLYFSNNTNSKFLGKVKLMKLFYFLDFLHLKKYGLPVTYDAYYKLEHGPIPTVIKNIIDEAVIHTDHSELSDVIYFNTPNGTRMNRCLPIRKFTKNDEKVFSKSELDTLKIVCTRFGEYTTKQIEDASHSESAWQRSEYAQKINYSLAANDPDCRFSSKELDFLIESFL